MAIYPDPSTVLILPNLPFPANILQKGETVRYWSRMKPVNTDLLKDTPVPTSNVSHRHRQVRYIRGPAALPPPPGGSHPAGLAIGVGYSDGQISRLEQNLRLPDLATIPARFAPVLELEKEPARWRA